MLHIGALFRIGPDCKGWQRDEQAGSAATVEQGQPSGCTRAMRPEQARAGAPLALPPFAFPFAGGGDTLLAAFFGAVGIAGGVGMYERWQFPSNLQCPKSKK